MNNQFELGTPLNIQWHFKRPDGNSYSLAGQVPDLYCINARGRFAVPSVVMNAEGGYLGFTLTPEMQTSTGEYSFLLQLMQNGGRTNDIIYRDAVTLMRSRTTVSNQTAGANDLTPNSVVPNAGSTPLVQLFTVGEFNLYQPTAPVGGSDGYWYFNGQRIVDNESQEIAAYYPIVFTETGENKGLITVYKGAVSEGVVVTTFTAVKEALIQAQEDHERVERSENVRETNENTRKENERIRGQQELDRQENEGQGSYSDPTEYPNTRRAKETERQNAEDQRISAEVRRISAENTRIQNEGSGGSSSPGYANSRIKKELDRQAAEGSVTIPAGEGHPMPTGGSGRLYNEAVRQHNEDEREAAEAVRQATFTENEGTKQGSEAGDGSRWGEYKEAEVTRNNSYATAEGSRDESYVSAEAERNTRYGTAEGTLTDSEAGDGSRSGAYKTAEAARQAAYEANEGTSESSGDDSRWDAYKEAEAQRQSNFETAEATRNAGMAPLVGIFGCSTAAGTATKEVTISNYVLTNGGAFKVKFTYANSASSPTLKINSETAKAIVFNGAEASADNTWGAGEVVEFYYDPSYNSNAGGFIGRSTVISVSQNTETGKEELLIGKTPALIVDNEPEVGSNNLVKSGGVEKELPMFSLVGNDNNAVSSSQYSNIKDGHTYRVWLFNPNIGIDQVTVGSTYYIFKISCYNNNNESSDVVTVRNEQGVTLNDYYDFKVPNGYDSYLIIQMRANSGDVQKCIIQDITAVQLFTSKFGEYATFADLDSIETPGYYYRTQNYGGYCVVSQQSGTIIQIACAVQYYKSRPVFVMRTKAQNEIWSEWKSLNIDAKAIENSKNAVESGYVYQKFCDLDIISKIASGLLRTYRGGLSLINADSSADKTLIYVATGGNEGKLMVYNTITTAWEYYIGLVYDDIKAYVNSNDNTQLRVTNDSIINLACQKQTILSVDLSQDYLAATVSQPLVVERDVKSVSSDRIFVKDYNIVIPNGYSVKVIKIDSSNNVVAVSNAHTANYRESDNTANRLYDRLLISKTDNTAFTVSELVSAGFKIVYQDALFFKCIELGYIAPYNAGVVTLRTDEVAGAKHYMIYWVSNSSSAHYKELMWWDGFNWQYRTDYTYDDVVAHTILASNSGINDDFISNYTVWSAEKTNDAIRWDKTSLDSYVKSAISTQTSRNTGGNFLNMLILTDTHANDHNALPSIFAAEQITLCKTVDCAIHLGDVITTNDLDTREKVVSETLDYLGKVKAVDGCLFCKGNHDCGHTNDASVDINNRQYRMMYLKQLKNAIFNEDDSKCCYYYIDFPDKKVRMVVLDTFYDVTEPSSSYGTHQADWLYNHALDFSGKTGWSCIVCLHYIYYPNNPSDYPDIVKVLQAFADKGVTYGNYTFSASLDTKFVGVIHGHRHSDMYTNEHGYNEIGIRASYGDTPSASIITIDTVNDIIYDTKVGTGDDRTYSF